MAKKYTLTGGTKAFNAFLKGLIQLGVPFGGTVLLTVPGRKTGQPRSTPRGRRTPELPAAPA